MRQPFWVILGGALAANGLIMLFAAAPWYALTPGVDDTGPFNLHFIRDIGCAYLVAGASVLWLLRDARAWPAALAGGAFLALHALTHVWDFALGRITPAHAASDAVLVVLPAILVLRMAWRRREAHGPHPQGGT